MDLPTILVVDDESMVTNMLCMWLELTLNARILTSNLPEEARDILQQEKVSLLITDYLMPKLNGINLIKGLRNQGNRIPVILLTGYCNEPELVAQSEKLAPFEIMVKPWSNENLLQRIQYWLQVTGVPSQSL